MFAQLNDSLQIVSNRLHQAFTSNENGCYEIKIYAKPLTMRDTVERESIIKFYPSSSEAPQDSVRNFYYRCGFEPWGHLHHDGTNIWYNAEWKLMKVQEWDQSYFMMWLNRSSWYLYMPLLMKYNVLKWNQAEQEKYFIHDDSLYYCTKSYIAEDSVTSVFSAQISYQPRLHITIVKDFIASDALMSQYTRYEITEIDSDTISYIPKELNTDYLSLFPGYQWKPIKEENEDVAQIIEGATAIPWKGLLQSGDTIISSDIKERFVILDFWYKGCGPCWASIKELSKYNNGVNKDVSILGVNVADWEVKDDALSIFKRQGGNYQVLFDIDNALVKNYEVRGYPTIFVIDREKNKIIFRQNGHPNDLIEKIEASINKARG